MQGLASSLDPVNLGCSIQFLHKGKEATQHNVFAQLLQVRTESVFFKAFGLKGGFGVAGLTSGLKAVDEYHSLGLSRSAELSNLRDFPPFGTWLTCGERCETEFGRMYTFEVLEAMLS